MSICLGFSANFKRAKQLCIHRILRTTHPHLTASSPQNRLATRLTTPPSSSNQHLLKFDFGCPWTTLMLVLLVIATLAAVTGAAPIRESWPLMHVLRSYRSRIEVHTRRCCLQWQVNGLNLPSSLIMFALETTMDIATEQILVLLVSACSWRTAEDTCSPL